jgi:hypothetical protein
LTSISISNADNTQEWWRVAPGCRSSILVAKGWALVASTGLSWPDGRQAIVTFWKPNDGNAKVRCFAYYTKDMTPTGERCERVGDMAPVSEKCEPDK